MKKIIIAIDGHSSTGKSTLAKELAKALNYIYVDTGAMYRAVALFALEEGFIGKDHFDEAALLAHLSEINLSFGFNEELEISEMILNGKNVEREIRTLKVSEFVSRVAVVPEVRRMLVKQQQSFGQESGIVMDGRDIGTVVFPDAELKVFMTASAETRAERRYRELKGKGEKIAFEQVLENIEERDKIDSTRKDSPLRKADDAVVVDNSNLSREEQLDKVLFMALNRIDAAENQD